MERPVGRQYDEEQRVRADPDARRVEPRRDEAHFEGPRYGSEPRAYHERDAREYEQMRRWDAQRDPRIYEPATTPRVSRGRPGDDMRSEDSNRYEPSSATRQREPRGRFEDLPVHEVMTTRVVTVNEHEPVERAARLMEECDCGALPVTGEHDQLVGMVTDRDIALRIIGWGRDPQRARVSDCMTPAAYATHVHDRILDCMRQMARHQVRRVPVVDENNRLVGIVSQGDLARHAGASAWAGEQRMLADVVSAVSEPGGGTRR